MGSNSGKLKGSLEKEFTEVIKALRMLTPFSETAPSQYVNSNGKLCSILETECWKSIMISKEDLKYFFTCTNNCLKSAPFGWIYMPLEIRENIYKFLSFRDILYLSASFQFFMNDWDILWRTLYHSQTHQILPQNDSIDAMMWYLQNITEFVKSSTYNVSFRDFEIVWLNEYLFEKDNPDTLSGKVIKLRSVCWLHLRHKDLLYHNGTLFPPGDYRLYIHVQSTQGSHVAAPVEVSVKESGSESSLLNVTWSSEKWNDLLHSTNDWLFCNMGGFHVAHPCRLDVKIFSFNGGWHNNIYLDGIAITKFLF